MASISISVSSSRRSADAWRMVAYSTIGTVCCAISVVLANTGLFMRPMGEALGWSRADIALSLSIGAVVMGVINPFVGHLVDRFGTRPVLIVSQATYGAVTLALPWLVSEAGLTGFYIAFALISGLGAGSTIVGYMRLLTGWFSGDRLRSRGFALGCAAAGVPLGGVVTAPAAILLIAHFGWQGGFWGLSVLPLLVGLPISIFFIREAPVEIAADNGDPVEVRGHTLGEAARTGTFWMLIAMVLLISSCLQGMSIHIAPFLSDIGLSPSGLALITLFNASIAIPARLVAGHLFDRFFAPRVALVIFALPAFGALAMASHPVLAVGIPGSILLGVGQGAESDFIGYLVSRYFGLKQSGRIFGTVYGVFMLGVAIGPLLFGYAYDSLGTYRVPFFMATIGLTVLCVIISLLPRFPRDGVHDQP